MGREPRDDGEPDIAARSFQFALRVVRLCEVLMKRSDVGRVIGRQLLRSGTSVGANVEEAQAAQSRADFVCKMSIALKEARESLYWLRLLRESGCLPAELLADLTGESTSVTNILGAIVRSCKRPPRPTVPLNL
jgi:four helix bundle protein